MKLIDCIHGTAVGETAPRLDNRGRRQREQHVVLVERNIDVGDFDSFTLVEVTADFLTQFVECLTLGFNLPETKPSADQVVVCDSSFVRGGRWHGIEHPRLLTL